jgi:hypothetical protein
MVNFHYLVISMIVRALALVILCVASALVSACAVSGDGPRDAGPAALPVMQWDHHPEAEVWTKATLRALSEEGLPLLTLEPRDIDTWCPDYIAANPKQRAAFWAGLLSSLAKYESTWNPQAVGGDGRWFGLVQISPGTARGYGCDAKTGDALKNGAENLACAVRIAAATVPRDGVVASGRSGLAADWAPFLNPSHRAEMAAWTRNQSYCSA